VIRPPRASSGPLVLADIGGYTAFLRAVQVAHADDAFADGDVPLAYAFVSSLLDTIISRLVPPYRLSKLEGDAVFAYAEAGDPVPSGDGVIACMRACYAGFLETLARAHELWTCRCDACMRIDVLELKFIVHAGPYVVHAVAGADELAGPEVVMAHRLLKNDAAAILGTGAYALLTAAAVDRLQVPRGDAVIMAETYEHYAPVETFVFRLRD
jgi:hypothetical protein